LKNIKLILASFCLVLVGCDEDDDVVAADSCTASFTAYMDYELSLVEGTATVEDCELAMNGLLGWCEAGCEEDDSEDPMCTEDFTSQSADDITLGCGGMTESCNENVIAYADYISAVLEETATEEDCVTGYTALMNYCAEGCEVNIPTYDQICGDMEYDADSIAALCAGDGI